MVDTHTTLIWTLRDNVSASAARMNATLESTGVKAGKVTGIFNKLGVATGGLVTPTTLAAGAVVGLTGFLFNAARASADEQINIEKLRASLQANIPAWDGNTSAIEATIKARENLAFSDDELRDSLALLVGATHDVGKAFQIQSTAMDLARFKGISLQDATEALTRVEGGQYRALKGLGIVLQEGATQTDALAAVQKVASGQAQAYGNTLTGQSQAIQIKLHDLEEEIGAKLTPTLLKFAQVLNKYVVPALELATSGVDDFLEGVKAAAPFLGLFGGDTLPGKGKGVSAPIPKTHAAGGVMEPGEFAVVGEAGPEFIVNGASRNTVVPAGGGGSPVVLVLQMDGREVAKVVDRRLYYALNNAAPTFGRV